MSAFQDRELDSDGRKAVETHLQSCEDCRGRYEALAKACQMIESLSEIKPGFGWYYGNRPALEICHLTSKEDHFYQELGLTPAQLAAMKPMADHGYKLKMSAGIWPLSRTESSKP